MKEKYLTTARAKLEEMSKFLGDKPWFAGNEVDIITVDNNTYQINTIDHFS